MVLQFIREGASRRPGLVKAGREIEEQSFRIIDEEIGDHGFPGDQWEVVRRVIHTTGDFDYAKRMRFTSDAIARGIEALRSGARLFVDTRMVNVGLSPWRLGWYGTEVVCPSAAEQSHEAAVLAGITRTSAAFRSCASDLDGAVIAVGNAPTALLEVIRLIEEDGVRPALVIGVPVGFVQAEESKETLQKVPQASISVLGRKGGSTVAVAIIHALLELAKAEQ